MVQLLPLNIFTASKTNALSDVVPSLRMGPIGQGVNTVIAASKSPAPDLSINKPKSLMDTLSSVPIPKPKPHIAPVLEISAQASSVQSGLLTRQGWEEMKADARLAPIHPADANQMNYSLALLEKFRQEPPADVIQYLLDSYKTQDSPDWTKLPEVHLPQGKKTFPSWEETRDRQLAFARQFADNKPLPNSRLKVASDIPGEQRAVLQSHIDALHRNPAGAALMKFVDALPFDIEYRPGEPGSRLVNQSDRDVDLWFGGMEVTQRDDGARVWGPELDKPFPKLPIKGLDGSDVDSDEVIVLAHELSDLLKYDELIAKNIFHWASQPPVTIKDVKQLDSQTHKKLSLNAQEADDEMLLHFEAVSVQLEQLVRYWSHFTEGATPMGLRFPVYNQSSTFPWKNDGSPADWRSVPSENKPTAPAVPSR